MGRERAYMQTHVGQNVDAMFQTLKVDSEHMAYNPKSMDEMKHRGNELRRTKMFLVTQDRSIASPQDREIAERRGCLVNAPVYTYPGFQHASVFTYKDLETHALSSVAAHCSKTFGMSTNHVIATSYKRAASLSDRDDLIGPHRDRADTLSVDKPIIIVTYGDDTHREFVVTTEDGTEVFRCRTEPGTLIYLSYADNLTFKHQIVAVKDEVLSVGAEQGTRGFERVSLVLRDINQVLSISDIEKKTRSRTVARLKRARDRVSWFAVGRNVHNNIDCNDATVGEHTQVVHAKGKRLCVSCFPMGRKKQKVVDPSS